MPSPYTSRRDDEELLREAEERVKERGKTSGGGPHLNSHSRKTSRSSMRPKAEPTPSKWAKSHHTYGSHGIPEDWKHETTHHEDIDVVEATPTDNDAGKHDGPSTDYFNKFAPQTGPEYVRKDGTGVYPAPPLFNFNKPPAREKTPAREKPPAREKTPAQESRPERPRSAMPGSFQTRSETPTPPTRKSRSSGGGSADRSHEASRHDKQPEEEPKEEQQKQPPINVFSFEETAAPSPKKEKPAVPAYDFVFSPRPFDTFTSNSPEPKGEKAASTGSAPHLRPHSQPTQNHHSFVPPPSAPPNLQQQQQAAESSKSEGSKFNRELYDDLLKRTVFDFLPSGSKKKRSAPTLNKGRNMHRTTSKDSRRDSQPKAGSETESDEPKSATTATNPATSQPATGFGYEPMDAEPTGAPKTIPVPQNNRTKPIIPLANGMRKLNIGTKKGKATTSLDMSGMASVPPLSRSPADVGLGGFESLKESLPFPSQAATKPRVGDMRMKVPALNPTTNEPYVFSIPPDFWNLYPQTPLEQPFVVPKAPSVPKIPKQVSLDNYNRFYNSLGSYIEDWNKYEADVHALRAELTSKSLHVSSTELLDTQDIVKYMERVKNKDTILDQSFTKARDRHLASLDMWVKLRENVLKEVAHQEPH
ncbi:hypothetical protein BZA05DRAFT_89640 [Tricharina praecox]|uniref:uncharacterized protein n=1 Tax=Tricharina praecox TaxID=43433 RepID=UPI00222036C2|nr:uncharacterized protein BZA05DRAFT_89640 [Tricharina praecox]KAI5848890.1 hypothetical protein BZA05DRAFT_89640 [Tricharina praecox]